MCECSDRFFKRASMLMTGNKYEMNGHQMSGTRDTYKRRFQRLPKPPGVRYDPCEKSDKR